MATLREKVAWARVHVSFSTIGLVPFPRRRRKVRSRPYCHVIAQPAHGVQSRTNEPHSLPDDSSTR